VTGITAQSVDQNSLLKRKAPIVFGFVLIFAFLLLLVAFRSIVIALKAIVLNLLSVGAAYGVLVLTFQCGWGVRAVLLPASMKLLGDWNWYLPKWLEWLPRLETDPTPDGRTERVEASALTVS